MDQQLKQRLVGAVVLVSLAVIFIPVILKGPDDELTPRYQELPEAPEIDYNASVELPLPAAGPATEQPPAPARGAAVSEAPVVIDEPPAVPAQTVVPQPAPEPAPETASAPPPAPAPKPASAPAPKAPDTGVPAGWYAQVGSFSQQANADGLSETLRKAGYKAHVQRIATAAGNSYRVLAGPSDSREAATRLLDKLAAGMQLKGLVIELP